MTGPGVNVDEATVRVVDPLADARWDAFVTAHPRAVPGHMAAWSGVLARAYRFTPRYLALEDAGGGLRGVLPVAGKHGPLTGARLQSLPVVPGPAGPLGASGADETALIAAACRMAEEHGAVLRFRSQAGHYDGDGVRLAVTPAQPSYLLDLPSDAADLRAGWKRQGNLARNLRKAERAGLTVREAHGDDELRAFHGLYLRNMAKHGAIPHSPRFFAAARDALAPLGAFVLVLVEKDGVPIAATVSFVFADILEATFAVSDERYSELRPSYAVWWETIRAAIARGLRVVDFGGTSSGTQAQFKAQWGTRQVPAFDYVYPPAPATDPNAGGQSPTVAPGRRRRLRSRALDPVWRQAPPPVRRVAGEIVYRYL
jgi:CelD/BcsL family acetyltransferase involved in cellulose biosynthesis